MSETKIRKQPQTRKQPQVLVMFAYLSLWWCMVSYGLRVKIVCHAKVVENGSMT